MAKRANYFNGFFLLYQSAYADSLRFYFPPSVPAATFIVKGA
jgi:hypothetical protein